MRSLNRLKFSVCEIGDGKSRLSASDPLQAHILSMIYTLRRFGNRRREKSTTFQVGKMLGIQSLELGIMDEWGCVNVEALNSLMQAYGI